MVIGFGAHVHAVSMDDWSATTIPLGAYFGHLYDTADYLLIASAERLFRMKPDRSVRWQSPELGVDGVVVRSADRAVIRGEGEWEPTGGWRAVARNPVTGCMLASESE